MERDHPSTRFNALGASDVFLALFVFVATMVLFYPFASLGVDAQHDGLVLKPAVDVLDGQMLYRDTFSPYGPLATYLPAAVLWVFGVKVLVLRIMAVVLCSITAAALVLAWRMFLPTGLTLLAYGLGLTFAYFYDPSYPLSPSASMIALVFQALALLFVLAALNAPQGAKWGGLAGVAAALAFWSDGPAGAMLAVAVFFALGVMPFLGRRKSESHGGLLFGALGFAAVSLVFMLHLWWGNALTAWYAQNFQAQAEVAQMRDRRLGQGLFSTLVPYAGRGTTLLAMMLLTFAPLYRRLRPAGGVGASRKADSFFDNNKFLISYLGIMGALYFLNIGGLGFVVRSGWAAAVPVAVAAGTLGLLLCALMGKDSLSPASGAAIVAGLVAVASWAHYYPTPSVQHVFWALTPAFGPLVFLAWKAARCHAVVAAATLGLLFLPLGIKQATNAAENLSAEVVEMQRPAFLQGMKVSRTREYLLHLAGDPLEQYFAAHPRTPILLETNSALWGAFARNKQNPGPIYALEGRQRPEDLEARLRFIDTAKPLVFVAAARQPILDRLKQDGYRTLTQTEFGFTLYAPSDPVPVPAPKRLVAVAPQSAPQLVPAATVVAPPVTTPRSVPQSRAIVPASKTAVRR